MLDYPDSILSDIYKSLKENGTLSIRDEFLEVDEEKFCGSKKCGHPLAHLDDFMATMQRNGFALMDQTEQSGFPIYKFRKE